MKIVLIHGFNVRDGGKNTIDKLAPYLEAAGHEVERDEADYGHFGLFMVRLRKHSAVRRIVKALETADVVVDHSNGANYENKALELLHHHARRYQVIRLSPALNRKTSAAANVTACTVFHTRTDFWVWLSGFLPLHPWGRQGQLGYKGADERMHNRDFSDLVKGHSDYFKDENVEFVAKEVLLEIAATQEEPENEDD